MMNPTSQGWSHDVSPFHPGEQAIQSRLGVRDKMEHIGRRFIRDHMPDQHRDFYAQLPFMLVGSTDKQERPWASMLTGQPGFITSPDAVTLNLSAHPLTGDPLHHNLQVGSDLGLLGIDLATRRRNRINGDITARNDNGFTVNVTQSFGNCPQYIQKRQLHWLTKHSPQAAQLTTELTPSMRALINRADTLFIASRYQDPSHQANQGVDVSHRGGKPGFVHIESDRTFIFPDFSGNNFYNTLGNLMLDRRAGILFVDFEAGHLLSVTGQADIIWEGEKLQDFQGAERLIRITADQIVYLPEALPLRWEFQEYSPSLTFTGQWQ